MKSTKIKEQIKRDLKKIFTKRPLLHRCVQAIIAAGAKPVLVGGAVRDIIRGQDIKDIDIEVYNLPIEKLESILSDFGYVRTVGKSFGVLRLDSLDADWSIPRADSPGRKPEVKLDPSMRFEDASKRRDLTINAMGIDLATQELLDPFNGLADMEKGVLRAPDIRFFVQDPLRLFRVMQFMSRFDMQPDTELEEVCKTMDISGVSRERIEQEFEKLLLKSKKPSVGMRWLQSIGRLKDVLPELAITVTTPQRDDYHPEGDVFEHSMQSLDAAAAMEYASDQEKLIHLWAALLHDIGKIETTQKIEGIWKSLGHAEAGGPLARKTLRRITNQKDLLDAVGKLIYYHMDPLNLIRSETKVPAYKRLARKLAPDVTIAMLAKLWRADRLGRNGKGSAPLKGEDKEIDTFVARAQKAGVLDGIEEPILEGKDLLDMLQPGPVMGQVLKKAYEIQIDKGIADKEELKKRALQGIVTK